MKKTLLRENLCSFWCRIKVVFVIFVVIQFSSYTRLYFTMITNPTEDDINEFKYILSIHKWLVKYLGNKLAQADYTDHDDSKLTDAELIPYTLKFICKLKNVDNPGWKDAKEHHFHTNKHHGEYWRHVGEGMPEKYLKEATIDMMAAQFQYALRPDIVELVRVDKYKFDEELLKKNVDDCLRENGDFYFFKDRYIEIYTPDEKNIIRGNLLEFKNSYFASS